MNFDQFAATFRNPERAVCADEPPVTTAPVNEVVVVGTVLSATRELCCLDINGARYEIAAGDVIGIEVLSPQPPAKAAATAAPAPAQKKRDKELEDAEKASVEAASAPEIVMIKLKGSALMWRRTAVRSAIVAAFGTWMSVGINPPSAA